MTTDTITSYEEQRAALVHGVYFINASRRAFSVVVFELTNGTSEVVRTLTLKTNCLDRAFDKARCQRMTRRLRALGFKRVFAALGHPQDGLHGVIRMSRAPLGA